MKRTPFEQLTWRDKPVDELSRVELLELVEALHDMLWDSADNFECLLRFNSELMARTGGHA